MDAETEKLHREKRTLAAALEELNAQMLALKLRGADKEASERRTRAAASRASSRA